MHLPRSRSSVILQEDGEDLFLLDTEGGEVFHVNATAGRIFSFCQGGGSYDAAVAALAEGLTVPGQEAKIRADVEDTVKRFLELGVCEAEAAR